MTVGVNDFVRRQTESSRFSHFAGPFYIVAEMAEERLSEGRRGYRDGVLEVDLPPHGFFSSIVTLKEGDTLMGKYEARRAGETPRKWVGVLSGWSRKTPAKRVTAILYRRDVLAENNEASTDCDWELVSINASPDLEPEPITVDTLLANHFGADGGTATNMTDSELVAALRKSWEYWKNKSMLGE